jgi:hypothetical protein
MPGQLSPWQALLAELRETGVRMTQLRLQVNGVTIIGGQPAKGELACRGYLQCIEARINLATGAATAIRGLGSIYGDLAFITWVDPDHNVWQDVRPLAELKVHSTLA